jgi:hypothetical protein
MIKFDAITRISQAIDRIEDALNIYAAVREFCCEGMEARCLINWSD